MERHPPLPMTPFDEMVTTPQLQTMKLLLPYFPTAFQKMFAFYIKFTELQNTLRYFSNIRNSSASKSISTPFDMLEELRPYMNPKDSDSIESVLSLLNMMEMMKAMNNDSMPDLSNLGDMSDIMNMMNMFQFDTNSNDDSQKGNDDNE